MNKMGVKVVKNSGISDGTIRGMICQIRKKLKALGAEDLIPKEEGGAGYWIKGRIHFSASLM